jgi:hypothetical protein
MIVKQALRRVQDIGFGDAEFGEMIGTRPRTAVLRYFPVCS